MYTKQWRRVQRSHETYGRVADHRQNNTGIHKHYIHLDSNKEERQKRKPTCMPLLTQILDAESVAIILPCSVGGSTWRTSWKPNASFERLANALERSVFQFNILQPINLVCSRVGTLENHTKSVNDGQTGAFCNWKRTKCVIDAPP